MGTASKTNILLSEVRAQVKQSFNRWYVGTSERDDVWRKSQAEMVVFNALDCDATKAVYEELIKAGMKARKPLGRRANYLYLYRADGVLPDGFIY